MLTWKCEKKRKKKDGTREGLGVQIVFGSGFKSGLGLGLGLGLGIGIWLR
jgi:hypothetical protein